MKEYASFSDGNKYNIADALITTTLSLNMAAKFIINLINRSVMQKCSKTEMKLFNGYCLSNKLSLV